MRRGLPPHENSVRSLRGRSAYNGGMASTYMSTSSDAAENLAVEETLLSSVSPGEEILFLCVNEPTVVIGRFQNPWRECRTGLARRDGVPLRRRVSGGGTVVHGPGDRKSVV